EVLHLRLDPRGVRQVLRVGLLVTDGLALLIRVDGAVVLAEGEPAQAGRPAPDRPLEDLVGRRPHVDEPEDPLRAQPRRRLWPDAPERIDGEPLEEALDALRRDDRQAVGLLPARRDLGEELVGRDARRRGQLRLLADPLLEAPGDLRAEGLAPRV